MSGGRLSTLPLTLSVVACGVLLVGLGMFLAPLHPRVLALQFTFTPDAFARVLQAWGPEGVQRFRAHLPVDGLLLMSYGAAGYFAATRTPLFAPLIARSRWTRWAALLPLAAVCDAGENLLQWWLTGPQVLADTAQPLALACLAASVCALVKWGAIAVFASAAVAAKTVCKVCGSARRRCCGPLNPPHPARDRTGAQQP